jgi:hypothetical protein
VADRHFYPREAQIVIPGSRVFYSARSWSNIASWARSCLFVGAGQIINENKIAPHIPVIDKLGARTVH